MQFCIFFCFFQKIKQEINKFKILFVSKKFLEVKKWKRRIRAYVATYAIASIIGVGVIVLYKK